jgi:DNA-binding MarR family transcriptional regulator
MIRNRTSVKPGLFLQPYIVDQLAGVLIARIVEGGEVTSSEYAVTSWLNVIEQATPGELARQLGLSPTTLSAMIERLVAKGQMRRVQHPEDGRSYILELTAKGKATNARNAARFEKTMRALRTNLEGDPEEILEGLRRLEDALRKTIAES